MVALEAGQCIYSIWGIYYPDRYLIGTQVNFGKSVTGLAVEIGNLSSLCQALRTALQKAVDSSQADSSLNSWGVLWVFYIDLWRNQINTIYRIWDDGMGQNQAPQKVDGMDVILNNQ